MSNEIIDHFDKTIRLYCEAVGPLPNLEIDRLLGFSDAESDRLIAALHQKYPPGHWALERAHFPNVIEKGMQLLSAGLCALSTIPDDNHPLDCCIRIINSPTLSPFIVRREYNYIVIPTGFISALEKFISSTFALAAVAASQQDPGKRTAVWNHELFLGSIATLAFSDVFTFTRGVMEASMEASVQQVLDMFSDQLTFVAFDRKIQSEMLQWMPAASGWERLGFKDLDDALNRHLEIKARATTIARLSICFTICHEFGHAFAGSIKAEESIELAMNETFADMMGTLMMNRLSEAEIIPLVVGSEVQPIDLGHALAAFHSWSLSKELGGLLKNLTDAELVSALDRLHEVAGRWEQAMELIQKVWVDQVAVIQEPAKAGFLIVNEWSIMTAGMLRVALLKRGHLMDVEMAGKVLPLLANRRSKIYGYLGG